MYSELLKYDLGEGVEAFSTRRESELPHPVIQGHQVHEAKVAFIERPGMTREELEGYDVFVTTLPGVAIGVRTADCVPVLHISEKTVELMAAKYGCNASDIRAVLGPSIGPDSFQVCGIDTFTDESFFSARREGVECGRIINSIKLI